MRNNTQLITSYTQTALFLLLAARCIFTWSRAKDRRSAHLAVATSLYSINSLISAINTTIYKPIVEQPPRWESILSSFILYAAVYAFLLFLADFVQFPNWLKWLAAASTVVNMLLSIFIHAEVKIVGGRLVITHRTYVLYVLAYLAVAFGILGFTFLFYGMRVHGLARFRLASIGTAFTILFVLIGLLPLLLFENPTTKQLSTLTTYFSWIGLATAPMLFVGFATPRWISKIFEGGPEIASTPA
jgi:hypothetical protein